MMVGALNGGLSCLTLHLPIDSLSHLVPHPLGAAVTPEVYLHLSVVKLVLMTCAQNLAPARVESTK